MGPITLFDKSFIQSLSIDSSVWFDRFFLTNICPVFYAETLANLNKDWGGNKSPEIETSTKLAAKFPDMNGFPCLHHFDLLINNLLGHKVPTTGQIPSHGRPAKALNTSGIVHDKLPEADDFLRWASREFSEADHEFAVEWYKNISNLDLDTITNGFKSAGINQEICPTLQEAKKFAENLVNRPNKSADCIETELDFLGVPSDLRQRILDRWISEGRQVLSIFAPYAAYMLTVENFFYIARAAGLIPLTTSSWMDLCYLYYLPFCMVFVSTDKLHKRCAPLFMREDQQFIWGEDLKNDLISLNKHYCNLPDEVKAKGMSFFARKPPKEPQFLVAEIWDRHFPDWRDREKSKNINEAERVRILERVDRFIGSKALPHELVDFDLSDPDSLMIRRCVRKKKGTWNLISDDMLAKIDEK